VIGLNRDETPYVLNRGYQPTEEVLSRLGVGIEKYENITR
jgi:UDP-N-acetylglucosamine enolpyruvyl transferase